MHITGAERPHRHFLRMLVKMCGEVVPVLPGPLRRFVPALVAQPLHRDLQEAAVAAAEFIQAGRRMMIGWAVTFLIIALIAGVLGLSGIAGTAVNIAWILFVVGLILAVVAFIFGRRPRV